jgi:hypothetical protein
VKLVFSGASVEGAFLVAGVTARGGAGGELAVSEPRGLALSAVTARGRSLLGGGAARGGTGGELTRGEGGGELGTTDGSGFSGSSTVSERSTSRSTIPLAGGLAASRDGDRQPK